MPARAISIALPHAEARQWPGRGTPAQAPADAEDTAPSIGVAVEHRATAKWSPQSGRFISQWGELVVASDGDADRAAHDQQQARNPEVQKSAITRRDLWRARPKPEQSWRSVATKRGEHQRPRKASN